MPQPTGLNHERVEIESRADLRRWLEANHRQSESIWLVTYKKSVPDKHVPYDDIVEEALCFGWIDSLPRKLDEMRTMLRLSPRKPGSGWSRINKERAERMIASGAMRPAGQAKIDEAKADGSWSKLDGVDALEMPRDLELALSRYEAARGHFEAFPASVRRGILEWIEQAKRPETRARRVEETARLAADNIRANQFRPQTRSQ
jgi:uncharacterized protein YdeI (YjbR/CyaY-like superfamily)